MYYIFKDDINNAILFRYRNRNYIKIKILKCILENKSHRKFCFWKVISKHRD